MGGAVSTGQNNDDLINNLLNATYIRSPIVEKVFRAVDRGDYFLPDARGNAYKDLAWKCGHLHLSAPCIYSEVMEGLSLSSGLSFLNLGSGTGYLSTMVGLILGINGINHGIEIHEDVIQYANKKLGDFKRHSAAIDEFDFCEPKFTKGNCLCLTSDRQYDRVYCGAACPESYESYMKNLLKVGGILVMPLNDHLMQIKRTSEMTWTGSSLLPVSFASLILPPEGKQELVEILDVHPLSLQCLSRSVIRSILRKVIEIENPNLNRKPSVAKPTKKKERALRRLVVPLFDDSADEQFSSDDEHAYRHRNRANNIFDIMMDHLGYHARSRRDAALLHAGQLPRAGTRHEENTDETELASGNNLNSSDNSAVNGHANVANKVESCNIDEDDMDVETTNNSTSKETRSDVPEGIVVSCYTDEDDNIDRHVVTNQNIALGEETSEGNSDDITGIKENGQCASVVANASNNLEKEQTKTKDQIDEELQEDMNNLEVMNKEANCDEQEIDCDKVVEDNLDVDTSSASSSKKNVREKFDSGFCEEIVERMMNHTDSSDQENMEMESSSSSNDDNDTRRNKRGSRHNSEVRGGAKWRRICLSYPIKSSISTSSESENVQEESTMPTNESRAISTRYSAHMRSKIQQLPLPPILRNYLNFYREF